MWQEMSWVWAEEGEADEEPRAQPLGVVCSSGLGGRVRPNVAKHLNYKYIFIKKKPYVSHALNMFLRFMIVVQLRILVS